MGDEKKLWEQFEKLAVDCVKDCYCKDGTEIAPTQPIKDNGYDALILNNIFQDDDIISLLEAKLRSKNIGLRDIAATVIIGFNLGVYRIFFVINNYATPQFEDEVNKFQEKTNIRCTIVDNQIIRSWIEKLPDSTQKLYSQELLSVIYNTKKAPKTTVKDKKIFLKNFSTKTPILKDTISKFDDYYESDRIKEDVRHLNAALTAGKNCIICGGEGCGKSVIISKAASNLNFYSIDMANCMTTRTFAIKILYSLWGIGSFEKEIVFDNSEIEAIASCIGSEHLNNQTKDTLKFILNTNTTTYNKRADLFNVILLEYLKKLLQLHSNKLNKFFYFHNLEKANADVLNFLRSFCSLLCDVKVQFLLEIRTPITDNAYFTSSKWEEEIEVFKGIDNTAYMTYISEFSLDESLEYLAQELDGLTRDHLMVIINSVGNNPLFLKCAIEWLKNNKIVQQYPNNKVLVEQFKPFFESLFPEQNMIFAIKWIEFFLKRSIEYNHFLTTLYILDGAISFELYEEVFENQLIYDEVVIELERNKIIYIKNDTIIIKHQVYLAALEQCCSIFRIKKWIPRILQVLYSQRDKSDSIKMKILDLLFLSEKWENMIMEYQDTLSYLESTCQFKVAYVYMKKIMKAYEEMSTSHFDISFYGNYLHALQRQLQLSATLKYIGQPSEKILIEKFGELLDKYKTLSKSNKHAFDLFYYYINSQYHFRNAEYENSLSYCNFISNSRQEMYSCENIELLGRLCIGHALAIKEMDGYEAAKIDFEDLIEKYPASKLLKGEYLVHLSCMELDSNPNKAYEYTKQVIDMFKDENMHLEYPLFHKYVDLAMELLFAKRYIEAKESAYTALELATSNGILAEEGRAKNILGCCEYLINGEIDYSINLIKSSCFLLEKSFYIPYLWRSRINLATFYIMSGDYNNALPYLLSAENHLLTKVKDKIMNDIRKKLFHSSREYIALLLIGVYYKKYYDNKYFQEIKIKINANIYEEHINNLVNNIYPEEIFANSSFLYENNIFIIG